MGIKDAHRRGGGGEACKVKKIWSKKCNKTRKKDPPRFSDNSNPPPPTGF